MEPMSEPEECSARPVSRRASLLPTENQEMTMAEVSELCSDLQQLYSTTQGTDIETLKGVKKSQAELRAAWEAKVTNAKKILLDLQNEVEKLEVEKENELRNEDQMMKMNEARETEETRKAFLNDLKSESTNLSTNIDQVSESYTMLEESSAMDSQKRMQEVPALRHMVSLYGNISGIKWDDDYGKEEEGTEATVLKGTLCSGPQQRSRTIKNFELNPELPEFERIDQMWSLIDHANQ